MKFLKTYESFNDFSFIPKSKESVLKDEVKEILIKEYNLSNNNLEDIMYEMWSNYEWKSIWMNLRSVQTFLNESSTVEGIAKEVLESVQPFITQFLNKK